jgi:HSP20 family molecular chaperone IbpA
VKKEDIHVSIDGNIVQIDATAASKAASKEVTVQ